MTDFRRFWGLGFHRLTPIIPPDAAISERSTLFRRLGTKQDGRGKTPGTRGRDGLWASFDWAAHESDESDLDRWSTMAAGVGIKTGQGLLAIDADTLDTQLATTIRDIIDTQLGRLPVRVGNAPKALYVCRVDGRLAYSRVEFGAERVEVLTDGKQFVADGIHPKTGKPYTWPRGIVAFDDLPIFKPEQIHALMEALRMALPLASKVITEGAGNDVAQASLAAPLDTVRAAVRAIPNTSAAFPSRESYRDMGYAIKAALPDNEPEAFELFTEWCDRWQDGTNEPDVVAADWRRMKPPYRRGASWLLDQAAHNGVLAWYEPVPEATAAPAKLLPFISLQDAAASALTSSARPLVKGLLDQGTLSVMYGPSNVGKTFVCMDVAFHIAAGLPWGGMKTTAGTVVYVAAEGGAGARKRADALCRRFGSESASADFQLLLSPIDLLRPDADLEPLIASIAALGRPVSFVALDTLARVMAGGEENSSVDMGTLVKHFDKIRKSTGAHVMVVHHSGKDAARGARGHSLLRAATDTEIEIGEGQVAVTKQRDLDRAFSTAFRLDVVTLGADEDGEPITSCTVELVRRIDEPSSPLTPKEEAVLDALNVLISAADDGARGVRVSDVAEFMGDNVSTETVRSHLKNMAKKHSVVCPVRGYWAPKSGRNPSTGSFFVPHDDIQQVESGRENGRSVFD